LAVVVFGFEPFLEFDENPTELVVRHLDGKTIGGERLTAKVLPVDYARVERTILDAIEQAKPKLVIGFGLAQNREKITPEKIAVNYRFSGEPDNAGRKVGGARIDESEPDGVFSNLPVERLTDSLNEAGIPAAVSFTAGAYLCNNAMFVIVREARKQGFLGGFVHVPCHSEWVSKKGRATASLPIATIAKAAEHSVIYCLSESTTSNAQR
jgi:pyroglutamyl-peptidase